MIATRLEDSVYSAHYTKLEQTGITPKGVIADTLIKYSGKEVKNANGDVAAIKYDKDGIFHYLNSGGRFGTFAFQLVTEGSVDYRIYVSLDGVHWDDKCKAILYDYVDEDFDIGHLSNGTVDLPATDVFYYHVIGRLHFKIVVTNVIGEYFINALD